MRFWIFLLISASLCASETYLNAFPLLRDQESWERIIALGEETLSASPPEQEAAKIHGHLASSYFYLGNFGAAEMHARVCYESSCRLNDRDGQVHGLYLLSATARARGQFDVAKAIARLALPLSEGELRAKVLFNLGAAEGDDPQGDSQIAKAAYEEALSLFECSEDQQRCRVRLGKIYLLSGDIASARSLLDEMGEIQCKRIAMHANYLSAQIEKAAGNLEKAKEVAEKALDMARKLGAKKDEERMAAFLGTL